MMNTCTANIAAFLTLVSLQTGINTVPDLRGKAAVTIPIYQERLFLSYGVGAVGKGVLPCDSYVDVMCARDLSCIPKWFNV
jgi:hypothetical protein